MIQKLARKLMYKSPWMEVFEDSVQFNDGNHGIYSVVEKPDFSLIVPMYQDGSLTLVAPYRYPIAQQCWEFPQGANETLPDLAPEDVARSELKEETGLSASRVEKVGEFFNAYGFCTQKCHVFKATWLSGGEVVHEFGESGMLVRRYAYADVASMIESGKISDGATLAALTLLKLR